MAKCTILTWTDDVIYFNPFSPANQTNVFANSLDPNETALMSRLIGIYTVCHFVLIFDWDRSLKQSVWPDPKTSFLYIMYDNHISFALPFISV